MVFKILLHDCRSLFDYHNCDQFFRARPKPKGRVWQDDERPLRDARSHHLRISPAKLNGVDAYELYLHATPLVTHFADGRIKLVYHDSASSNRFIEKHVPFPCGFYNRLFYARDSGTHTWHWHQVDPTKDVIMMASRSQTILSGTITRKRAVLDPKYKKSVAAALKDYSVWKRGVERLGIAPTAMPFMNPRERDAVASDLASRISANDAIDQESFIEIYTAEKNDSEFRTSLYSKLGAWVEKEIDTTERPKKHHHSIPNSWVYS